MPQLRRVQRPPTPARRIGAAGLLKYLHRSFQGVLQDLFGQFVKLREELREEIRNVGLGSGGERRVEAVDIAREALEEDFERDTTHRAGPALSCEMPVPGREFLR